jgi:hypothetical protein
VVGNRIGSIPRGYLRSFMQAIAGTTLSGRNRRIMFTKRVSAPPTGMLLSRKTARKPAEFTDAIRMPCDQR